MTGPTITVAELEAELARLSVHQPDRPQGYYTYEEIATAYLQSGACVKYNAAVSRAKILIREMRALTGKDVPMVDVITKGPTGRIGKAVAFKIGVEKKKR